MKKLTITGVLTVVMALAASPAQAVLVDIGGTGQDVQSGAVAWDAGDFDDNNKAPSKEFTGTELGTFTAALDVADVRPSGGTNTVAGTTLSSLLGDHVKENHGEIFTLTLSGLDAGTYTMTTYHHGSDKSAPYAVASIKIEVDGEVVVESLQQTYGADLAGVTPAAATFAFDAVGPDNPVAITFTNLGGAGISSEAFLNGFELVPEPATMSLLGLGGLVALRRRRSR